MFAIKKIKVQKVFIGIIFACVICSCTTTSMDRGKAPLWVTDINAEYPENNYLAAVGQAQDREGAEAQAISNISKILKQRVEAESTATQVFENNLTEQNRDYETSVKTTSLIDEIVGIKIQEVWDSKQDKVYALAVIDRKEVGSYYAQKINEIDTAVTGFLNFMIDNEATFEGVSACEKALSLAQENATYLELLAVINPTMYKSIDLTYKSASAVSVLYQLEKEKIYVGVFVTGDEEGRITSALSESFIKVGFKSGSLENFAPPSLEMPYVLYGELSISPFNMTSSQNNKYVRFTLNTELVDKNNKTSFPWSINGREAHLTESEAAQRALRTIEQEIQKVFYKEISNLL